MDCRRNPRAIRISSVVDCLLMAGREVHSELCGGGLEHGLGSRDEQQLLDSGERGVRIPADDDCLLNLLFRLGLLSRSRS